MRQWLSTALPIGFQVSVARGPGSGNDNIDVSLILSLARHIVEQDQILARSNLQQLESERQTGPKEREASTVLAQPQDQVREAVLSKTEVPELPVELITKVSEGQGEARELSLLTRLDPRPVRFHKQAEHNVNTLTFVFAVFDEKENLVEAQQRRAKVNVLDEQLPELFKTGLDLSLTFYVKPGAYRVREVVTDSEENHMTAFSRIVRIP